MDTDQDSLTLERVASELAPDSPVNWSKVRDMMEDALKQLTDRLKAHVTQVSEESLHGMIKHLDDDHNMEFI